MKELILENLLKLTRLFPEQRMGQIIFNYVCSKCPNNDPFYIEDEDLLEILENTIKEIEIKRNQRTVQKQLESMSNDEILEFYEKLKSFLEKN